MYFGLALDEKLLFTDRIDSYLVIVNRLINNLTKIIHYAQSASLITICKSQIGHTYIVPPLLQSLNRR